MGVPTFISTEKSLKFSIYDSILTLRQEKVLYLTKSIPLTADFIYIATHAEYNGLSNRPTAVKGLINAELCNYWQV